tara:strand:+ start:274 stop:588 length:315 start_codon:yes stop_codon:yes gene_type:complete
MYIESEKRSWGRFFGLHDEPTSKLRRIEVDSWGRLSYQYHHKRSDSWTILEVIGTIIFDEEAKKFYIGETILIPQGSNTVLKIRELIRLFSLKYKRAPTLEKMT